MSEYVRHATLTRWVLADPTTLAAGERVAILNRPSTEGYPRATVVKVNRTTATVATADGTEYRVPLAELDPVGRRTGTNPTPELEADERPVAVIPCGGRKADHRAPAGELYQGSYFKAAMRAALELADPERVFILSARHGLVPITLELEPYEQRIGDTDPAVLAARARRQARVLLPAGHGPVHVLAPRAYAAVALEVFPDATDHLAGSRGIGDHLARFAELYRRPSATLGPVSSWEPLTLFAA